MYRLYLYPEVSLGTGSLPETLGRGGVKSRRDVQLGVGGGGFLTFCALVRESEQLAIPGAGLVFCDSERPACALDGDGLVLFSLPGLRVKANESRRLEEVLLLAGWFVA